MEDYKKKFIEFLVRTQALQFGEFTLKSGRKCPYFLNMGKFYMASHYTELVGFYADALNSLKDQMKDFNVIFGPAYKGIPLSAGAAAALYMRYKKDVGYSFNRKEAKDHGEGGMIVGAPIDTNSRIVIVDDVMTAGTALRESLDLLKKLGPPTIVGVLIAVDRMEKGQGEKSAVQEMNDDFGVQVYSIVTLQDIIDYLYKKEIDGQVALDDEKMAKIMEYRKQYGVNV